MSAADVAAPAFTDVPDASDCPTVSSSPASDERNSASVNSVVSSSSSELTFSDVASLPNSKERKSESEYNVFSSRSALSFVDVVSEKVKDISNLFQHKITQTTTTDIN